jgi:hypothetical protein
VIWFGAIVSLCYVPGMTGAYIETQWPVLAVLSLFGIFRSAPFTVLHGLGALFVLYAAIGVWHSVVPYDAVFGFWLIVLMGLNLWLGSTLVSLRDLYIGLAIGGAVSSGIAVLQYVGWQVVPTTSFAPAGIYVNSVQQGAVLALLIVALATERLWLWIVPLVPGLVLSDSRGAWFALAVGLAALKIRRVWVFGVVGVIVGVFFLFAPLGRTSDQERVMIWEVAWHGLKWLGWGPGAFSTVSIIHGYQTLYPGHTHNDALQLLFEYGIGAVLPFVVFSAVLLRTNTREWPVLVAFAAAACYSMPLYMPITSLLAVAAVGRILRDYAVPCGYGCDCGFSFLSRRQPRCTASLVHIPVEPHYQAKG